MELSKIKVGQVVRITRKSSVLDITGFVKEIGKVITLVVSSGPKEGEILQIDIEDVVSVTEILSCPLWHRLKKKIDGSQAGGRDLQ